MFEAPLSVCGVLIFMFIDIDDPEINKTVHDVKIECHTSIYLSTAAMIDNETILSFSE